MFYLGVDGGGTKTAFAVIDENGRLLSELSADACNYVQIGKEGFGRVLARGAAEVCKRAGIGIKDITFACAGIPSFGEIEADSADLIAISKASLQNDTVRCVNDVEVAWAGSLACRPGINLLAGTGSIGYGKDRKGHAARAGGWGYFCGDEGSAYWLGRKLIELFTKEADGRAERSAVYEVVRREFGLKNDFDLIYVLYNKLKLKRDEIAKLQLLLNRAADLGDVQAKQIYAQAAYELHRIVAAVADQLDFGAEEILLSYSGGVFKAGALLFDPLKTYLHGYNVVLREPILSPVLGAALCALASHLRLGDEAVGTIAGRLRAQGGH